MELEDVISRAKDNDQLAFNFLLDSFWGDVYTFQLKRTQNENDAEDITIQTFSRAFDKISTYDERYNFKTWLITISKNIHIDFIRKRKSSVHSKINSSDDEKVFTIIDESPTIEDKIIKEQNLDKLLRDIKKLKPHYQQIINLRFFQEMSYKAISRELEEPMSNVKVKLLRAKKLLAQILTNKDA